MDDTELWLSFAECDLSAMAVEKESVCSTGNNCWKIVSLQQWNRPCFDNNKYRLRSVKELQMEILLSSGTNYNTREKIWQSETHTGSRVLVGVWLEPARQKLCWGLEDSMLCAKGAAMCCNISTSKLSRYKVTTAYAESMLCPSMLYCLCGTTFSEQDCETIDRSYIP